MPIARDGSVSAYSSTTGGKTSSSWSHTTSADVTLMLLEISCLASEGVSTVPQFDGVSMTLVAESTSSGNSGDVRNYVYGMVSPGAKTANVTWDWDTGQGAERVVIHNYSGTETSSVANAAIKRSEDVNDAPTNTGVHASVGTDGNALLLVGTGYGGDMQPASSISGSFNVVNEGSSAATSTNEVSMTVADKLTGLPSAVTITYPLTDDNASQLIEIIAASASIEVTSVGPGDTNVIYDGELRVEIDGANFTGVAGTVYLNDATTKDGSQVTQTQRSWADGKIVIDVDKGALSGDSLYILVEDSGATELFAFAVTCRDEPGDDVQIRASMPDQSISQGVPFSFDADAYFYDKGAQETLTYEIVSGAAPDLAIDGKSLIGILAEDADTGSPYTTTVRVTDPDGNSADDTFQHTVSAASSVATSDGSSPGGFWKLLLAWFLGR